MAALNVHVICCNIPPTEAPDHCGQHWVDTSTGQMWLAVGTSSVGDWILLNKNDTTIEVVIPAGNTVDIDAIPMIGLCSVKYLVCMKAEPQDMWKSLEMLAGKKTSTSVEDTIYSKIGSNIKVDLDFDVVGTDAKLTGTNNETFDVTLKIHKNQF
jgi:hypothetical protein